VLEFELAFIGVVVRNVAGGTIRIWRCPVRVRVGVRSSIGVVVRHVAGTVRSGIGVVIRNVAGTIGCSCSLLVFGDAPPG
jgi:hypothetical protein